MQIVKKELKTYKETAHCDCGNELQWASSVTLVNNTTYEYKCDRCCKEYELDEAYPKIIYEEIKKRFP